MYLQNLQLAEKKVQRVKAAQSAPDALSSSVVRALLGRYYQVGDNWDVAVWRDNPKTMMMTSNPDSLKPDSGLGGIFHYEVVSVANGATPEVSLKVTQKLLGYGFNTVDQKVDHLTIKMSDKLIQDVKSYAFVGNPHEVRVSPEGVRAPVTTLELLPLDAPDVITADQQPATAQPEIPARLADIARDFSFKPDLAKSSKFEQDDFFGRPVEIVWTKGDPWPTYMKTAYGTAILIRKEAQ